MAFRELTRHVSFLLRDKFNDARRAFTNVSPTELLTEEATNSDPWGPETKTMATIAEASFERDEYERIVQVLHQRLNNSDKVSWRQLHKTLVVLEYLLLHGPYSLRDDFRAIDSHLEEISQLKFVDKQGIDKSSMIKEKAGRILDLLIDTTHWKTARAHAKKKSVDINGFGSYTPSLELEDVRENTPTRKVMSVEESFTEGGASSSFPEVLKQYNRSITYPIDHETTLSEDERSSLLTRDSDALRQGNVIRGG